MPPGFPITNTGFSNIFPLYGAEHRRSLNILRELAVMLAAATGVAITTLVSLTASDALAAAAAVLLSFARAAMTCLFISQQEIDGQIRQAFLTPTL